MSKQARQKQRRRKKKLLRNQENQKELQNGENPSNNQTQAPKETSS